MADGLSDGAVDDAVLAARYAMSEPIMNRAGPPLWRAIYRAGYAAGRAAGAGVPREPTQRPCRNCGETDWVADEFMCAACGHWEADVYDAAPRAGAGSTDGRELDAEPIKMPDLRPGPSTHQPAPAADPSDAELIARLRKIPFGITPTDGTMATATCDTRDPDKLAAADRITALVAEHGEDQSVIRVWRGRAERAEADVARLTQERDNYLVERDEEMERADMSATKAAGFDRINELRQNVMADRDAWRADAKRQDARALKAEARAERLAAALRELVAWHDREEPTWPTRAHAHWTDSRDKVLAVARAELAREDGNGQG